MPIVILIGYLVIGVLYAMNAFSKAPHARPLGATEEPIGFFFLCLALWPVSFLMHRQLDAKVRSNLPPSIRTISKRNVVDYLRNHSLQSLTEEEITWCQHCLSEIVSDNFSSSEALADALMKGVELPQQKRQKEALDLEAALRQELESRT